MISEDEKRKQTMLRIERSIRSRRIKHIAGLDEAGRGPLAGPVVAAAVIFPDDCYLPDVDDSKKLTPARRKELFDCIMASALSVGVGIVSHEEIDRINILNATFRAMYKAVLELSIAPDYLLVDGNVFPEGNLPFTTVVGGDALCFSIAAASIIAKVTRDRIMCEYDARFPGYGFAQHKGYATLEHREAIARLGYCAIHRRSFRLKEGIDPDHATEKEDVCGLFKQEEKEAPAKQQEP